MATTPKVILNVLGTNGNDTLQNTGAVEMIDGGLGIDKVTFVEGTQGVTVNLATGTVTDSFGFKDTITGVEIVVGTSFNDTMTGSAVADYLVGNGGDDKLSGGVGSDELYGGTGNDTLNGGADSDYIVGGEGNDAINGGSGFDLVDYSDEGGTSGVNVNLTTKVSVDTYGTTDTLTSVERVRGTELVDTFMGNSGANLFEGGDGNDTLDGAGGHDLLWAGFGDDMLIGGTGNDQLVGGRGFDTMNGGKGVDTADYSLDAGWHGVSVNLTAGSAEDTWGDVDTLIAVENVVGSEFADWIMGSAVANSLTGGAGDDVMTGGAGVDTFVFAAGHGHDQINDYVTGDLINLQGLGFTTVDDVLAAASGHELGAVINTGEGSSIVLVDVNVASLANLGYIFS
jgi:Ca2+-binding RTX toxin-like protein